MPPPVGAVAPVLTLPAPPEVALLPLLFMPAEEPPPPPTRQDAIKIFPVIPLAPLPPVKTFPASPTPATAPAPPFGALLPTPEPPLANTVEVLLNHEAPPLIVVLFPPVPTVTVYEPAGSDARDISEYPPPPPPPAAPLVVRVPPLPPAPQTCTVTLVTSCVSTSVPLELYVSVVGCAQLAPASPRNSMSSTNMCRSARPVGLKCVVCSFVCWVFAAQHMAAPLPVVWRAFSFR